MGAARLLKSVLMSSAGLVVSGLTNTELAMFTPVTDCYNTEGVCNGAYVKSTVAATSDSTSHMITANGVPDHSMCPESTASGATCYQDPLTTWLEVQSYSYQVPKTPTAAATPGCLSAGAVGIAKNGVAIFSPYSRPCTDAFADEAIGFDSCMGHPQEQGQYHYHTAPVCLSGWSQAFNTRSEFFVGVAFDGFPIYGPYDSSGNYVSNSALDSCHGYDPGSGYRYIANDEFPYIIGCYKGTASYMTIRCHCNSRRLDAEPSTVQPQDSRSLNLTAATLRQLQPPGGGGTQNCDTAGSAENRVMCGTNSFAGDAVNCKSCWGKTSACPAECTTTLAASFATRRHWTGCWTGLVSLLLLEQLILRQ